MREPDVDPGELSRLLAAYAGGDPAALDHLVAALYGELKEIARGQLRRLRPQGLETTALVHEAYLKLAASGMSRPQDREHFFAVCARAMRHLVVDQARAQQAVKRGGGDAALPIETAIHLVSPEDQQVERVHLALERLESVHPRLVRLLELRVFGGFSESETASLLGLSLRTVQRDWQRARAWLRLELDGAA
jgi:RNA polymerase sigma factor (TIGR02999 family)